MGCLSLRQSQEGGPGIGILKVKSEYQFVSSRGQHCPAVRSIAECPGGSSRLLSARDVGTQGLFSSPQPPLGPEQAQHLPALRFLCKERLVHLLRQLPLRSHPGAEHPRAAMEALGR